MIINTSYFYEIRYFTPNMIPVSTCLWDPLWYRPPLGEEYFIDKRGVVNGLRYEPIIVQPPHLCPCPQLRKRTRGEQCDFIESYRKALFTLDKEKILKAFEHCLNKFNADTIVLIVYEAPNNYCSEREVLQEFFECEELEYLLLKQAG